MNDLKAAKWIAFAVTIASGIACLIGFFAPQIISFVFFGRAVDASAIGIIGGADGPTSVFVTGSAVPNYLMPMIFVLSLLTWLFLRFKSKDAK